MFNGGLQQFKLAFLKKVLYLSIYYSLLSTAKNFTPSKLSGLSKRWLKDEDITVE